MVQPMRQLRQCDVCHKLIHDVQLACVVWFEKTLWDKTECGSIQIVHDACSAQLKYRDYGVYETMRSLPLEYLLHLKTAKVAAKISPGFEKCFDELLRIGEALGFNSGKKKF